MPRVAVIHNTNRNAEDQAWKSSSHWQSSGDTQGHVAPTLNPTVSTWPVHPQVPSLNALSTFEHAPRPLPYPPIAPFHRGPAVNLASTFKQLSKPIRASTQHDSQPVQTVYPSLYGGASQQTPPVSLGGIESENRAHVGRSQVPTSKSQDRKQTNMHKSSWRRSDDARNHGAEYAVRQATGNSQAKVCPNTKFGSSRPYQPCDCDQCEKRNRSVYLQLIKFDHVLVKDQVVRVLTSGLTPLIGEVEALHTLESKDPFPRTFIVT